MQVLDRDVLSLQIIIGINHLYTFSRSFMFSDDEEETKRVVRSQKDKRFVNNGVLTENLLTTPHSVTEHSIRVRLLIALITINLSDSLTL